MKKILALTLSGILVLGGSGIALAASAASESSPAPSVSLQAEDTATQQNNLYLVPGTYVSDGETVENVISSGATKLTDEQCEEIYTQNAYLCSLSKGATLPVPESERVDGEGNAFAFNGWWTIVDATVTYFKTVPEVTETTFLYADWRADLSQRKDPIEADESTIVKPANYISIQRAATGETEILTLRVSGASDQNADSLGYGAPVELYNDWFELNPGDVITVYATGLGGSKETQLAPLEGTGRKITLENSGDGSNNTGNYLTATTATSSLTYRKVLKTRSFRIYIKFYSNGLNMAVYMEPMN